MHSFIFNHAKFEKKKRFATCIVKSDQNAMYNPINNMEQARGDHDAHTRGERTARNERNAINNKINGPINGLIVRSKLKEKRHADNGTPCCQADVVVQR